MFRKIDLHVHTPCSTCYLDHTMPEAGLHTSPGDIVAAALANGLSAIAVTNHNTVDGIEEMVELGQSKGLVVFPGIELSATGGHALAIFDIGTPPQQMAPLLAAAGFTQEDEGKGFAETSRWLDEIFEQIERFGGLAIAAHVDRKPKGFFASEAIDAEEKRRILLSPHLSALEITVESNKSLWNLGRMPGYYRRIACLQGSDAHAPGEVGRRYTLVDIPSFSLKDLRQALIDYPSRIRFPSEMEAGLLH